MTNPTDPPTPPYGQPYPQPPNPGDPYASQPPDPYAAPISGNPYSPAPQQPQIVVVRGPASSGMAVASMVLGIVGLVVGCCSFGVFSILAVILGHVGLSETKDGSKGGRGMAVAGLVMGYIGVAPALFISATWFIGLISSAGTSGTAGH